VKRLGVSALAGLLPMAAQAECLGQGCYSGLAVLLGLMIAFGLGVIVMVVLMIMRRWGAAKIVAVVLGGIVFAFIYMLGQ
jgi:hypothetical protein